MPTYQYEHEGEGCKRGKTFEMMQSMQDDRLTSCPECGGEIERLLGGTNINVPKSDTDLRDKGFAKLVRRDKGVYENVTAMKHEKRYWKSDDPSSMPDIASRISD